MNVHETLVKARAIQARGWCQGALLDPNGNHCIRGSIEAALCREVDLNDREEVRIAAEYAIVRANHVLPGVTVVQMNDSSLTTWDDVLGWFDKAIEATKPEPVVAHDAHTYELQT